MPAVIKLVTVGHFASGLCNVKVGKKKKKEGINKWTKTLWNDPKQKVHFNFFLQYTRKHDCLLRQRQLNMISRSALVKYRREQLTRWRKGKQSHSTINSRTFCSFSDRYHTMCSDLTLPKIAIWLSKHCQKLDIFVQKNYQKLSFWQFSGGSGMDHTIVRMLVHPGL